MNDRPDTPDDDLDEAGLWDPRAADDALRSLRRRLLPHAHRPRAWVVPEELPESDDPLIAPPSADGTATPAEVEDGSPAPGDATRDDDAAGDDDGWPWPERDAAASGDAPSGARGARDALGSGGARGAGDRPISDAPTSGRAPRGPAPDAPGSILHARSGWGVRLVSLVAATVLVVLAVGELLGWRGAGDDAPPDAGSTYRVEALEGTPRVTRGGELLRSERLDVRPGDRVVCDDVTRAELRVRSAGSVRLEPGTELHVDDSPADGWRLFLARGQVTASIFAPPRLFQVGTPSGIAVDLGCVYTATVGDDGETVLAVRGGQVSFEAKERKVFVPDGARVVAWPGRGPGTPVWEDAPAPVKKAVEALDALRDRPVEDLAVLGLDGALAELRAVVEPRQSLSLWHLLDHPNPQVARGALATLERLSPPPWGVDPAAVLRGRAADREAWREDLERHW